MMGLRGGFRLEMLQVARLAPKVLGEAGELVVHFLNRQLTSDGGFADREGHADLYYTVFGLEGLQAMQCELPEAQAAAFLKRFGEGEGLDLVHLCSLARCAANLRLPVLAEPVRRGLALRIEGCRTPDGGYHGTPGKAQGSAYGALLAWGAYADLRLEMPEEERLMASVERLRLADGSFANEPGLPQGTATATAAAVTLCHGLGGRMEGQTADWLLRQAHAGGGFLATPFAPLPDLLSTATVLHALVLLGVDVGPVREACLDFIDSLWSAEGGFHGHWADDHLDVEYTSYGLLALGHLS